MVIMGGLRVICNCLSVCLSVSHLDRGLFEGLCSFFMSCVIFGVGKRITSETNLL